MTGADTSPALRMRAVARSFGDVRAVDAIDLDVMRGEVHALLGENGAGKTTLMRIAYGVEPADSGTIELFGQRAHRTRTGPREGVGMVHQHLSLVPSLTVAENIALGRTGLFRRAAAEKEVRKLSETAGLLVDPETVVGELSVGLQQRVEILKALSRESRLLILDEPTAILAPSEAAALFTWIAGFRDRGGSVVLVTHKLREALAIANRVTVLRRGRSVYSATASEVSEIDLARAMFPDIDATQQADMPPTTTAAGTAVVTARELTTRSQRGDPGVVGASLTANTGDIVGVAGIEGSGHRSLLAALARLDDPESGDLELPRRIALIPADRQREALVSEFSLSENLALRGAGERTGLVDWNATSRRTASLIDAYGIVAAGPHARAHELSGGNQQRLVVARELGEPVDLIVAIEPTRGLDIRATAFVHAQIQAAARAGSVVFVHSSDVDEIIAIATRVLVVFHGRVVEVPLDRDRVARAMVGADV